MTKKGFILVLAVFVVLVGTAVYSWAGYIDTVFEDTPFYTNIQSSQPNPYYGPWTWGGQELPMNNNYWPNPTVQTTFVRYGLAWGYGNDPGYFLIGSTPGPWVPGRVIDEIPPGTVVPFDDGIFYKGNFLPGTGIDSFDLNLIISYDGFDPIYVNPPNYPILYGAESVLQFSPIHVTVDATGDLELAGTPPSLRYVFGNITYVLTVSQLDPWFGVTVDKIVPEPSTMLLVGSGLVVLFGFKRKFRK